MLGQTRGKKTRYFVYGCFFSFALMNMDHVSIESLVNYNKFSLSCCLWSICCIFICCPICDYYLTFLVSIWCLPPSTFYAAWKAMSTLSPHGEFRYTVSFYTCTWESPNMQKLLPCIGLSHANWWAADFILLIGIMILVFIFEINGLSSKTLAKMWTR